MVASKRVVGGALLVGLMAGLGTATTHSSSGTEQKPVPEVSPVRQISPTPDRTTTLEPLAPLLTTRSIDGSGNNLAEPAMAMALTPLARWANSDYADDVSDLAGAGRPSPRAISNAVSAQTALVANLGHATDFFWQWGQFLDHDIDLTGGVNPPEPANILVPTGDPEFDPAGHRKPVEMAFNRSVYDPSSGSGATNPRQQLNETTSWIDASNVYGSNTDRATALRTMDDTGRLRTSDGDLLPFNTNGLPNAGGDSDQLFLAGDVRANEQVGLTALHTLFVREHNRLAAVIADREPTLTGDEVYEQARAIVGAQMQVITYKEFLPVLLGPNPLGPYKGYDPDVDARIANIFSTAAYRFGHSAVSPTLLRLNDEGEEVSDGHLALSDAFFAPYRITDEGGIEPVLRGLARQICQAVDLAVVDGLRNFLFGDPGSGGFDLVALNIQRGRDHGLLSYNDAREVFGLERRISFSDITSATAVAQSLEAVYQSPDDVDVWVGGLAEDPVAHAQVGPLFHAILTRQFQAVRDGDRFWYERSFSQPKINQLKHTRLSDIIRRNTEIGDEVPDNVFRGHSSNGQGAPHSNQ